MLNGQVLPHDLAMLGDIAKVLEQRKSMYGRILVRSFIGLSKSDNQWKNALSAFIALKKDDTFTDSVSDYGDTKFREKVIGLDELPRIIEKTVKEGVLSIPGLPDIKFEGYFSSNDYLSYLDSGHKMFRIGWPSSFFQLEAKDKGININSGPYVGLGEPLYPNYMYLTSDRFKLNPNYYHQFWGGVLVFLPNYKAKITEVRLGSTNLSLSVQNASGEKLVANLFLYNSGQIDTRTVKIEDSKASVPLSFIPDIINVYLLADTGEKLDHRDYHLNYPTRSEEEDIVIDIGEEDVMHLISRGESETVEFKQEITKNKERFAEGIVAFANTYGGTVFIGVDDNASIVGTNESKLDEIIPSTIRSNCDPPIEVRIERKIIDEKQIVIVRVPEGENKPYVHKSKGVLVRSGSTNRIASRYELEEFFKAKENEMNSRKFANKRR